MSTSPDKSRPDRPTEEGELSTKELRARLEADTEREGPPAERPGVVRTTQGAARERLEAEEGLEVGGRVEADQLSAAELRERSETQREAVRQTAEAVRARLERAAEPVQQAVSRARHGADRAASFVRRHPWAFLGGSFAMGTMLGVRGGRRRRRVAEERRLLMASGEERAELAPRRRGLAALAGTLLGRAGAMLAREAAGILVQRFELWRHEQAMNDMANHPDFEPGGTMEAEQHVYPHPEHFDVPR